jgi:hypothetical protein
LRGFKEKLIGIDIISKNENKKELTPPAVRKKYTAQ